MAQRGGSVVTQVRVGEKIYGPVIDEGEADFIVAFEKLEALRWVHYLRPGGTVVVNNQQIDPMTVITGQSIYPPEILETLLERAGEVVVLDALQLAREAGSSKAVNVVLLGALARQMDVSREDWHEAIRRTVAPAFLNLNIAAFNAGFLVH